MFTTILAAVTIAASIPADTRPGPTSSAGQDTVPVFTLAQALGRAVRLNPNYVAALGSVAEADWARKAARVAFFIPSAQVSLDQTWYSQPFFNFGTLQQSKNASTLRLGANYEILSARKFTDLGRTQAELEATTANEVQQRFAAALLTEAAYYGVLADRELVRVARDRSERAAQQLVVSRARVSSGAAVQTDSLTVRIELIRAQVEQLRIEAQLKVAQLEFGRRVGLAGPAEPAALDSGAPSPMPLTLEEAVRRALEQGPEYRTARARERAAEAKLKGDRGAYLPVVYLTAGHNRFDETVFPNAASFSNVTIGISLPIWDNGRRELTILQARTDRDVSRAFRSDLERAALRDVTFAYEAYETARAQYGLAMEGLVASRESYRVQDARYRSGATTVLDLIVAQNSLSDAEAGLVQAQYVARLAFAQLEAILGARLAPIAGEES
ncbi:MAG: TolC family protein [Gemmatimonadota bacterium]|nr:TolC family protein [Gemmatimonadota bacterium]